MTTQFRNLDFDPRTPLEQWPAEAIATVIDRGSLSDWRDLAREIRRNPWGSVARTVAAGTSASRLSDYENAKVAPTTDVLARLQYATAIHTHPHELAKLDIGAHAPSIAPTGTPLTDEETGSTLDAVREYP
jgi:hypothetical protein